MPGGSTESPAEPTLRVKYPWRLMQVAVLNGVNLNMLGQRDPAMYGNVTLTQLETMVYGWAKELHATARCWHRSCIAQ